MLRAKIGWLDHLANATHQFYYANNTGGPGIKVHFSVQTERNQMKIFFFFLPHLVSLRHSVVLYIQ